MPDSNSVRLLLNCLPIRCQNSIKLRGSSPEGGRSSPAGAVLRSWVGAGLFVAPDTPPSIYPLSDGYDEGVLGNRRVGLENADSAIIQQ